MLSPKAQYWIGLSYVNLGQSAEAIQAFQKVIQQYRDSDIVPDAMFQLGTLYRQNNELDNSISYFNRTLSNTRGKAQDPSFISEVYYQIGLTHLKQTDDEKAKIAFRKSIDVSGGSFSSYQSRIELARILARAKMDEEAQKLLSQVIQDRNDELAAEAQKVSGDVLFQAGKYQEAVTAYLRVKYVYQAYPSWVATALYSAGNTYEKMGKVEDAKKVYEEVVNKYPAEKISEKAKERLAAL